MPTGHELTKMAIAIAISRPVSQSATILGHQNAQENTTGGDQPGYDLHTRLIGELMISTARKKGARELGALLIGECLGLEVSVQAIRRQPN